jgi:hypothetical protein
MSKPKSKPKSKPNDWADIKAIALVAGNGEMAGIICGGCHKQAKHLVAETLRAEREEILQWCLGEIMRVPVTPLLMEVRDLIRKRIPNIP